MSYAIAHTEHKVIEFSQFIKKITIDVMCWRAIQNLEQKALTALLNMVHGGDIQSRWR